MYNRTSVQFFCTVRFGAVSVFGESYGAVRCGAVFTFSKPYGAVRCGADFLPNGAVRCGIYFSRIVRCVAVRLSVEQLFPTTVRLSVHLS